MEQPDQQQVPDFDLVAATASGGSAAFELLYNRYERRVYNYARTFLRQPALAEEVVIDTMMAVWHGARGCKKTSQVSTWILGIARHKALDAVRKAGSQGDSQPIDAALDLADASAGPHDAADHEMQAKVMLRAIGRLSADHREILRLAFYEDLSYEEIAALLHIPDNTVKTRVFYAKQQLKKRLEALGVEAES